LVRARIAAKTPGYKRSSPVRFLKTYESVGANFTMSGGWSLLDEPLLKSLGDEALGIYTAHWYTPSYDSASNKRFVATMHEDYNELPGGGAAGMYVAGQVIDAALQKTGGNVDNKSAFMDAVREVDLTDTPRGRFHFDKYGNAVGPIFIRKCERRDGKLVNVVIKTYPDVNPCLARYAVPKPRDPQSSARH
jgi:branched-chain amino acid transport system substrate-binding protein